MSGHWPERWRATRLKFESSLKGRLGWQGLTADEYRDDGPHVVSSAHFEAQKIRWDLCPRVSTERYLLDENIQLAARDILLMKDGAALGKLAYVDALPGPACLNSHLLLFRPLGAAYDQRFLFHLTTTDVFQDYMQVYGTGATFMGVSQRDIGNFPMALPALSEQVQIARFLDYETARIDALIEKQQQLIALLKEKRQAVISHAVTKGLNLNAPLRDSGVEWLGMVPAHWTVRPLKQSIEAGSSISYGIVQPGEPLADGVPFVQTTNMSQSTFDLDLLQRTSPAIAADFPRSRLDGGEVILGIRASIGAAYVVPPHLRGCNLSRGVARIRPSTEVTSEFLVWYFRSASVSLYWGLSCQGSTFSEVSIDTVKKLVVPVPPLIEQRVIAEFILSRTNRFHRLIANAEEQNLLLQERRTALISAAVTGKIDVRGWTPPISTVEQEVA